MGLGRPVLYCAIFDIKPAAANSCIPILSLTIRVGVFDQYFSGPSGIKLLVLEEMRNAKNILIYPKRLSAYAIHIEYSCTK